MQNTVTSLVFEGVFERFPKLKVVLIEGGFAWAPALCWRMDKHWERMRAETPHVKRPPSEYVREQVWFTTQPIEEPENPQHLAEVIEWLGWDRLMFSTDYPHWDFDHPQHAFKFAMTEAQKSKVFRDNAQRVVQAAVKRQARGRPRGRCSRRASASSSTWPAARSACSTSAANISRSPTAARTRAGRCARAASARSSPPTGPAHYALTRDQRIPALPVARLGVRHPHRPVVVRPEIDAGAAVPGHRRAGREAGEGAVCRRDLSGVGGRGIRRRRNRSAMPIRPRRTTRREAVGGARQAEILAQRGAFVLRAEQAAALQFRHHQLGEIVEAVRKDQGMMLKPSAAPP